MAAPVPIKENPRTRVLLHLPLNDAAQLRAVLRVFDYLNSSRERGIEGFTHSLARPPVFAGYWWNTDTKPPELIPDRIVVCVLDLAELLVPVPEFVRELKAEVDRIYLEATGRAQEEIWVIAHAVVQYARPLSTTD